MKSVNYKINYRNEIELVVSKLKTPLGKKIFIRFLENNVKKISGDWNDTNILTIEKENLAFKQRVLQSREFTTRLAKLEEKWLGLD